MLSLEPGIHQLATRAEAEKFIEHAAQAGWPIFRLREDISSVESFFETVRETLPLAPPVMSCHLEALEDSLWGGMDALQAQDVLVVWHSAHRLRA